MLIVAALTAIAAFVAAAGNGTASSNNTAPTTLPEPRFSRFFVIVLENTDWSQAMAEAFFSNISSKGRLYNQFHATTHPSQPNYFAMVAGSDFGWNSDKSTNLTGINLADTLEAKGKTWKSYQESYPGNCNPLDGTKDGLYQRKHNPFMSFDNIRTNKTRCANIVDEKQLDIDIKNKQVPDYVLFVPNQIHDGHGIPDENGVYPNATAEITKERILAADKWLSAFLPPLIEDPYFNTTLFFITFDENDVVYSHKTDDDAGKANIIYSLAIGSMVEQNTVDNASYNHYSQLALLQKEWGLPSMGRNDTTAVPLLLTNPSNNAEEAQPAVKSSASAMSLAAIAAFLLAL